MTSDEVKSWDFPWRFGNFTVSSALCKISTVRITGFSNLSSGAKAILHNNSPMSNDLMCGETCRILLIS